jgi:hypothetical protein
MVYHLSCVTKYKEDLDECWLHMRKDDMSVVCYKIEREERSSQDNALQQEGKSLQLARPCVIM